MMSITQTGSSGEESQPAIILGGGVGPMAGVMLHQAIIRNTPHTRDDSDHIDVWHISTVKNLPDRTAYLVGREQRNPAEQMATNVTSIGRLLAAESRSWLVGVPCATFHAPRIFDMFAEKVLTAPGCRGIVNLVEQTIIHLMSVPARPVRVGVLSTLGSYREGVWRKPLAGAGFEVVDLAEEEALALHAAIYDPTYGLKAVQPSTRRAEQAVLHASVQLVERGAQAIVLGCTELPFVGGAVAGRFGSTLVICDPLDIQSRTLVALASRPSMRRHTSPAIGKSDQERSVSG